ncbi:hypothetical protein RvY_02534-2 [Ramazzottius varieornatus]|uniref:Hexosyltransferase n=1 Tax=Ramazzottius varieornatus TaxID=947166 RepID=A0A1D1UKT8_RAMVA|nr:hypothetical protein RvY_02534-2 [Ramazzottius varieornatus]
MSNAEESDVIVTADNRQQARRTRSTLFLSSSSMQPTNLAGYRYQPSLQTSVSTDETDNSEDSSNDEIDGEISGNRRRRKQDFEPPTKQQMIYGPICILLLGMLLAAGNLILTLYLNGYYEDNSSNQNVYVLRPLSTKPPTVGQMLDPEVIEFVEEEIIAVNESYDVAFRHQDSLTKEESKNEKQRDTDKEPSAKDTDSNSTDSRHLLVLPPFSLQPHNFCHKANDSESTPGNPIRQEILLVMVTDPEDNALRNEFRHVWSNYLPMIRGDLMFVLATPQVPAVQATIKKEAEEHGDMLQLTTMSSGQARYLKTLAAMQWTTQHCPHVKFFVRMNVDVLVQVESLQNVIDRAVNRGLHQEPVIIGDVIGDEQDELSLVITKFPNRVRWCRHLLCWKKCI